MNDKETTLVWEELGGNKVLRGGSFYISYNPDTSRMTSLFRGDGSGEETALVAKGEDGERSFFILNGDYRKEYEDLVPRGLAACMKFFLEHADRKSSWSD